MRARRLPGLLLAGLAPLLASGPALAQEEGPRDETERWVPSFSIFAGVMFQDSDGFANQNSPTRSPPEASATDGIIKGDPCPPAVTLDRDCDAFPALIGEALRANLDGDPVDPTQLVIDPIGPVQNDELLITPYLLGSVELMTPGLQFVPSRPRAFVRGDVGGSFAFTRDVAREGAPGELVVPELSSPADGVLAAEIEGQGSTVKAEVKPFIVSAGAGIAFTLDWGSRRIRIKPSVEYLRERIEVTGIVNSAIPLTNPLVPAPNPRTDPPQPPPDPNAETRDPADDFRLVSLTAKDEKVYHGLGPGLEVELDAARTGPLVLSVYASGSAYSFFGDLKVKLDDRNANDETAKWTFQKNRWGYRAGVGLRFRWLPED